MSTTTTTYQYDTHEEAEQEIIRLQEMVQAYAYIERPYDTQEEAEQEIIRLNACIEQIWAEGASAVANKEIIRLTALTHERLEAATDLLREAQANSAFKIDQQQQKYDELEATLLVSQNENRDLNDELLVAGAVAAAAEAVAARLRAHVKDSESEDDDSSSDYNPDEDEEEEVVPTITLKEVVKATGRNPEGAAAAKKRIKQIDEVIGLLRDRAPPVPTTAFGDGTCGSVDFTRPSMFGNENPELR